MKMKMILPMMLIAALPLGADAQNKSGLVMSKPYGENPGRWRQ